MYASFFSFFPARTTKQADKYGVPRMCFINKMDRTGANFYRAVQMIKVCPRAEIALARMAVLSRFSRYAADSFLPSAG